ncbi:MAG: SDR family oxidoreductase [Legionella sp.]|nr:SDR family oxidoreductase [Legionella sp.]
MKIALITGANRGLGLEFSYQLKNKGYHIIGCCRNPSAATELNQIADEVIKLDVTSDDDIKSLVNALNGRPIDLLVNNAGITGEQGVTVGNIQRENYLHVLNVNCVSVVKICDALLPNLRASADKSILVISSQMGSISDNNQGRSYAYRSSKAALNCVMHSFALDVKPMDVHVMLMHPGWVKTDMGGPNAAVDAKSSVAGMLREVEKYMSQSHADILYTFDGNRIGW